MKKFFPAFLLILSACQSFNSEEPRKTIRDENTGANRADVGSGPKKRIVVLPFLDADPARNPEFRERARQAFILGLARTKDLLPVDSKEMKSDPTKMLDKGEYRMKEVAAASRDLGVTALLEGKILEIRVKRRADAVGVVRHLTTAFEAVVRVRMATARGGKEFFNTTKTVTVEQADVRVAERVDTDRFIRDNPQLLMVIVKDAFLDFTPQISAALDKVSWEGRIAALSGDRLYLNVGRLSGLQIGDLLKVSEEGDDVYDPESGSHLGKVPGRLKGTLEIVSYFGVDGSIAIVHSGAGFKENDRVELYQ